VPRGGHRPTVPTTSVRARPGHRLRRT
jgi:hypothetical protein